MAGLSDLPVVSHSTVFHVGTLNISDKGSAGASYEGHGLSVSLDPDRWIEIAELGGLPCHTLTQNTGQFLDRHALTSDHIDQIITWGVNQGLVTETQRWNVPYFDSELNCEVLASFITEQGAVSEAATMEIDLSTITTTNGTSATSALQAITAISQDDDASDVLIGLWVERECPDLNGVWWNDTYGPMSAPRGVIVPNNLGRWTIS